jgi:hypothetical protein
MNPFVSFMQTPAGRAFRIVWGVAEIAAGVVAIGGPAGYVIAGLGLVPLGAGLFDICVMAPIFKVPFSGPEIRALKQAQNSRGPVSQVSSTRTAGSGTPGAVS